MNFMPNWICRAVVRVVFTRAAWTFRVPLFENTAVAGMRKFGVLVKLKNSERNWSRLVSVTEMFLAKEKSNVFRPAANSVF